MAVPTDLIRGKACSFPAGKQPFPREYGTLDAVRFYRARCHVQAEKRDAAGVFDGEAVFDGLPRVGVTIPISVRPRFRWNRYNCKRKLYM